MCACSGHIRNTKREVREPPLLSAPTLCASTPAPSTGITGWMVGFRPGFLSSTLCSWSLPTHVRNHLAFPWIFTLNWTQRCIQPHIFWLIPNFPVEDLYFMTKFKAVCTFDQFIRASRTENLKCKLIQASFDQRNRHFFFNTETKFTDGRAKAGLPKFRLLHGKSYLYQRWDLA